MHILRLHEKSYSIDFCIAKAVVGCCANYITTPLGLSYTAQFLMAILQ